MKLSTIAVHAGDRGKPGEFVPVTTPIYNASSYFYDSIEDLDRVLEMRRRGRRIRDMVTQPRAL